MTVDVYNNDVLTTILVERKRWLDLYNPFGIIACFYLLYGF